MFFWKKSGTQHFPLTGEAEPDRLEARLVKLRQEARPDFRRDLKERLRATLPGTAPQIRRGLANPLHLTPAWSLGLALGGAGVVALAVIIGSVLSVAVTGQPGSGVTPQAVVTTGFNKTSISTVASQSELLLYNASSQSYVSSAEAGQALGFEVQTPAQLPAGYRLQAASLQFIGGRPQPNLAQTHGYYLLYTGSHSSTESLNQLDISRWKVPDNFHLSSAVISANVIPNRIPKFQGAQKITSTTIQGQQGYLVQGQNWRLQITPDESEAKNVLPPGPPPVKKLPNTTTQPGVVMPAAKPVSPLRIQVRPPVMFNYAVTGYYYLDFVRNNGAKATRALVWQQDSILSVVATTGELNDPVLSEIAGSLSGSR